jgi:hypothetical protein
MSDSDYFNSDDDEFLMSISLERPAAIKREIDIFSRLQVLREKNKCDFLEREQRAKQARLDATTTIASWRRFAALPRDLTGTILSHCDPATLCSWQLTDTFYKNIADEVKLRFAKLCHKRDLSLPKHRLFIECESGDCESGSSMTLEEGWSEESLLIRDNRIIKALESADPGGQVSWDEHTEYDYEKAENLMKAGHGNSEYGVSSVDVDDFSIEPDTEFFEIGWNVSMERKPWTRRQVVEFMREYEDDDEDAYNNNDDDDTDAQKQKYVDILNTVCGLLMVQPQVIDFVSIKHAYRHTSCPSGNTESYVFIQTSEAKKYQITKVKGYQRC